MSLRPCAYPVASLGYLVGTALQLMQTALWGRHVYLAWMTGALIAWVWAMAGLGPFSVATQYRRLGLMLAVCALAFGTTGWRAARFADSALTPSLEGKDLLVTGVVAAMPQHFESGLRFRFDLESAQWNGQPVHLPPKLDIAWYAGVFARGDGPGEFRGELQRLPAPLQAGERWRLVLRPKAPHGGVNPYGFDYELWQWGQGVQATGYVRAGPTDPIPQALGQGWGHPVEWARQQVHDQIGERVTDPRSAGLIAALVVGDQAAIDRADWDVFRATGVAHLMSISGLHITMFAWGAAHVIGWLWRRSARLCLRVTAPGAALVGGVALACAYALFSGWGVPAQRTVLMLATVAGLRLLGLRWPWPQVWVMACVVVVAADPWAMRQAGFWLSFVAVGVLFATDSGANSGADQADNTGTMGMTDIRGMGHKLAALWREQWVITLALTPLSLLLFGQVSLVGLPANAIAIPWVTLLVTPLAMLGVLFHPLWDVAAWAIWLMNGVLQWLASWPWASVAVAQAPVWAGVAGVAGGCLLAMPLPWQWRLTGLPLLLPVLLWQADRPPVGGFELIAADIGQGNAVLVQTAHHALLYDAGPAYSRENDAGHRVLVPLLRALNVKLDTVVLSHRDSDHTGGARAVLMMQPQAQLLSSIELSNTLQGVRPATRCVAGQHWQWDKVDFEVLHPQPEDYGDIHKTNAMSCTLRISNQASTPQISQTVLLAGDIEQPQEAQIAAQTANTTQTAQGAAYLHANVLLVPHHGSKTSSSAAFLDAVQPQIAWVQAGYRNRFGHPAPLVMGRYAQRHIRVMDTAHCGAMTWRSWQPQSTTCQRDLDRHYWQHRVPD